MSSRLVLSLAAVAMALLIAGCGSSGSSSPTTASAAVTTCAGIGQHTSSGAIGACAQGYAGALAGKTLHVACLFGTGVVTAAENVNDCRIGYIAAGGGPKLPTVAPSAVAIATCDEMARESSAGSIEACEQGYALAVAGSGESDSCDHLGSGAVATIENATDCSDGWLVAKGQASLLPGEVVSPNPG